MFVYLAQTDVITFYNTIFEFVWKNVCNSSVICGDDKPGKDR